MAKTQKEEVKIKNIGLELMKKEIDLEDGNLVGRAAVRHQGQLGFLKLTLEGSFTLRPLLHRAIDWAEKKIPGDQTLFAS